MIEVNKRILGCIDFVASEAHYHRDCRAQFSGGKNLIPENQNVDRNRNEQMPYYFRKTCEWIGSETEIHTVTQFRDKMREYVYNDGCGDDVYYTKYIKQLLKESYKENIIICSKGPGKYDLISFHDMAAYLIKLKHKIRMIL